MPPRISKAAKAYDFLVQAEQEQRVFSIEEIANITGWKPKSVRTYISKKLSSFLSKTENGYKCSGISGLSKDDFLRLHSQRTLPEPSIFRPRFTPVVDALIDKSREAALLAVQIYNNPLIAFRTPGYIVQMIIAYTALFHAIFERKQVDYWYKDKNDSPKMVDGDKRAWELSECIKNYYGGKTLPEVENLKFFIAIRNKIEHRFIPALDLKFSGKCQALLMNFEDLLVSEFGQYFALGANLALALQFSWYSKEQQNVLRKVQAHEYKTIREFSDAYDRQLPVEIAQSLKYSFRAFLIPKLGNHAKSSDIAIEFVHYDPNDPAAMEQYEKQVTFIRDRHVPVVNHGMLRPGQVASLVADKTGKFFSINYHTNAWKMYRVRPVSRTAAGCNNKYCYFDAVHNDFVYTEEWVEFLCRKVTDPDEYERIKRFRPSAD